MILSLLKYFVILILESIKSVLNNEFEQFIPIYFKKDVLKHHSNKFMFHLT